jgi:hypothetical protein
VSHSNTGPGSAGSGNAGPVGGQWDWVREYEASGCLMFARGVSAEHMMSSFGMDPGLAMMLPAEQAAEACPLPVYDEKFQPIHPWVRAGKVGEWAFAIDETLILFWDRNVDLSAGTEAVFVHWTAKPTYGVTYVIDGGVVTQFDPGMAWHGTGLAVSQTSSCARCARRDCAPSVQSHVPRSRGKSTSPSAGKCFEGRAEIPSTRPSK